jgi:hypothetical protein
MSRLMPGHRKRLFIDPEVQGAIVRRSLLHWLLALLIASACLLLIQVLLNGMDQPLTQNISVVWKHFGLLLIVLICVFPLFAYDCIRLSNRFTGPIYSLRTALRKLADGEPIPDLCFRQDDFWNELARDVNRISARLDQRRLLEDQPSSDRDAGSELCGSKR